jgi:hypothetical protein
MLVTKLRRASLSEVLNHPWMIKGFPGPPDAHNVPRVPLRAHGLDAEVIRTLACFKFGIDGDIEKKLTHILESDAYIRATHDWELKHQDRNRRSVHDDECVPSATRWERRLSSCVIALRRSKPKAMESPTPVKQTQKWLSAIEFCRRELFPLFPCHSLSWPGDSRSISQDHSSCLSSTQPSKEPLNPMGSFHPLISMYYFVREMIEREKDP